jgi:hypothetical protein
MQIAPEQRDAERLIELASFNHALVEEPLELALGLLEHCDRHYIGSGEQERRALNQAFFDSLYVDESGVVEAVLNPPFAELLDRSITLARGEDDDEPPEDRESGGSNVSLMAEGAGFEPATQRVALVREADRGEGGTGRFPRYAAWGYGEGGIRTRDPPLSRYAISSRAP